MKRSLFIYTASIVLNLLILRCSSPEQRFDQRVEQKPVLTYQKIDSVLSAMTIVKFEDLPKSYIEYSNLKNHPKIYKGKKWYRVVKEDAYKYLVGKFRVQDFLPEDEYYSKRDTQYLLIDKRVLYKFNDLLTYLDKKGHDPDAFKVYNGFRHPAYNDLRGGAPHSRHLYGEAIDIKVKDINKDGIIDQNDKTIVLNLLEKKIIGNSGGVGRYIKTMSIHFDVRGWGARWNSYSREKGSQ